MGEDAHPSCECMHRVLSVGTWKVILLPSLPTGGESDDLSVCVNRSSWNPVLYQKVSVCIPSCSIAHLFIFLSTALTSIYTVQVSTPMLPLPGLSVVVLHWRSGNCLLPF